MSGRVHLCGAGEPENCVVHNRPGYKVDWLGKLFCGLGNLTMNWYPSNSISQME